MLPHVSYLQLLEVAGIQIKIGRISTDPDTIAFAASKKTLRQQLESLKP